MEAFEFIRLKLINCLDEPQRSAFWKAVEMRDALRGNYEDRHPNDMVLHPLAEIREWDEAMAVLGIQDSDQTPAEAIRERDAEIDQLRALAATAERVMSLTVTYLSAIRKRLEQLYDASADQPRLREQLSDEVDWIDAQIEQSRQLMPLLAGALPSTDRAAP